MENSQLKIIPATPRDMEELSIFFSITQVNNRHLDWQKTISWLGYQPILKCFQREELISVLVCPVVDQDFVWIRSFSARTLEAAILSWSLMIENLLGILKNTGITKVFSISLSAWYEDLLKSNSFITTDKIITLQMDKIKIQEAEISPFIQVRDFLANDIDDVMKVDHLAFPPLWQITREDFIQALAVSQNKSVALNSAGEIIGYQISSHIFDTGHIARIAVHPEYQRKKVASTLLEMLFSRFISMGIHEVTVNTSSDNNTAIDLYLHNGFSYTQNNYPIYFKNVMGNQ